MGQGGSGGQYQSGLNQSRIVCGCEFWTSQRDVIKTSQMDKDEQLGQPVLPNGVPLSKIHHAAFDAHLIGIDAEYRLHVSKRLLGRDDGPMLEALKRLNGETIHLPGRIKDRPDRDRLAIRFERFKAVA